MTRSSTQVDPALATPISPIREVWSIAWPTVLTMTSYTVIAAIFQAVDAVGIVYSGALRGAGDTVWPGVITMIYSWTLIVAGGFVMIRVFPGLESVGPWIAASAYIIVLGVTMALRFERGRWRDIRLVDRTDPEAAAALVAPLGPGPPATSAAGDIRDLVEEVAEAAEEGAGAGSIVADDANA